MKQRETNVKIVTLTVFIATFMTAIEATILATAMPTISATLKGGEIMSWVFSIYLLTNAMMTPIYGKLTDSIGRKPVFQFGIFMFILGSALCGISDNMIQLILFRAIQGIGAGAIMPVALTIIGDIYTVEKRAKVLGYNSAAWGIASVVGPLAGGFIVDSIGWHWIFFVNIPIGIILMILLQLFLVEPKKDTEKLPVDYAGSLTLMILLLSLMYGFQTISDAGRVTTQTWLCFGLTAIATVMFVRVEGKAKDPVISLTLLKNWPFMVVNIIAALVSGFLMGLDVYIPMWMQGLLGMKAAYGGLALTPLSVTWIGGSFIAGRLLDKTTTKRALTVGLTIIMLGAVALAIAPAQLSFWVFCLITAWTGIGLGITITCATVKAQSSVPKENMGVATSFNTLSRTLGQTIMVSIFGVVLNHQINHQLSLPQHQSLTREMVDEVANPHFLVNLPAELIDTLRDILYSGLHSIYVVGVLLLILAQVLNQFQKGESLNHTL